MEGPQLLEAATKGRHEEVARLLSDRAGKAAINYTDEVRETALYKAVTFNHAGIVKLLLEHGADPNIANDLMYTPLHEAAQYGHTELTPYGLAIKKNHKKAAKELIKG
ncbi:uncharacterized protein ACA1_333230 [Acanthamoeba castellanii str. Neff]|uniref:Uncharacterized protein n=1 Tax=Acanthamoeba castellanii (strain ATCC 30010 / Neff) TaxID=1257118 RepID=L8HIB9_ACACF|nr:uncharacterized protein ACA1_333230 [Acanthamoeba castellanii str. Neff]ELR24443.1 hypothetical protein ACA1_333230 [Acanthamoeba castellanii str. Neff]